MNKIKRIKIIELENYQEVIKEFSCGATELDVENKDSNLPFI